MKLAALLMLVPSLGFADKTFVDNKGATWDCTSDPIASIQGNEGAFTFTGPCQKITVNGNNNTVDATAAVTLSVNGNDNTVRAKGAKASSSGSHNTVDVK